MLLLVCKNACSKFPSTTSTRCGSYKYLLQRGFASRRDAPLPPLTNPVELAIRESIQTGNMNDLAGSGKPLNKVDNTQHPRMSTSELLQKKAEFEMRRAIHQRELEDIGGEGQKLKYKGTLEMNSDGLGEAMGSYITHQAEPSAEDLKNLKK